MSLVTTGLGAGSYPDVDYPLLEDREACARCGDPLEADDTLQLCKECRVGLATTEALRAFAVDNLDKQADFYLRYWALGKPPVIPVIQAAKAIFESRYNSEEERVELLREYALEHKKEFLEEFAV